MPMNRVQLQPGLSIAEFMMRYGTQESCEAALIRARWLQGFACPECGGSSRTSFRRQGRLYWQCRGCQYQCSLTSGTIFENTKLPLTVWFLAMHLLTQAKNNVAALELMRHCRQRRVVRRRLPVWKSSSRDGRRLLGRWVWVRAEVGAALVLGPALKGQPGEMKPPRRSIDGWGAADPVGAMRQAPGAAPGCARPWTAR